MSEKLFHDHERCDMCNECLTIPYRDDYGNCIICFKCYSGMCDAIYEEYRDSLPK